MYLIQTTDQNILIGASQLVNSASWTGELWYFFEEEDIISDKDVISSNGNKCLYYPLPISVSAGTFLDTGTKVCTIEILQFVMFHSLLFHQRLHTLFVKVLMFVIFFCGI